MRWLVLVAVLSACAMEAPPTAELASARAAIENASGAVAEYAPNELAAAQGKLALAQEALTRGDNRKARRLAEEAQVDARFASALSENERSRQ